MEYKIPNFSRYTIDDNFIVRSYVRKDTSVLKGCNGNYGLMSDDKLFFQCSAPKLLWCAKNKVNPIEVRSKDIIITKKYGVIEKSEMFRRIGKDSKIQYSQEEQEEAIQVQIEEANKLLQCLKSNDYTWLINKLEGLREDTASLLVSTGRATNNTSKEIAREAIRVCLDRFAIRHQPMYNVTKFYKETAKSLAKEFRANHKHVRSFQDNKFGCIIGNNGTVLNLKR